MTMIGRFVDHGICVMVTATLLFAVIISPTRLGHGSRHSTHSPKSLSRTFAKHKSVYFKPRRGFGGDIGMSVLSFRVANTLQPDIDDELEADIEDELTVISPLASQSFDILTSPCPRPRFELVSSAIASVARPLRC